MHKKFKSWIDSLYLPLDHLAIFRIFFSLFIFFFIGYPRFDWIASFPDFFYSPSLSIASFFDSFPSQNFFVIINFLLPLLILFVLVGYKTFWTSILLGILFIVVSSFEFAFGKINHSHFIPFTLMLFSFSGWGKRLSVDFYLSNKIEIKQHAKSAKNVLPLYALIISFSYFTSGFSKLVGGWLELDFQAAYAYLVKNFYFIERQAYFSSYALDVNSLFIWEVIDYIVVIVEMIPLFFIFNKKVFSIGLFFIVCFHLIVYLVFNISFGFYPLLLCVFIINWKESQTIVHLLRFFTNNIQWLSKRLFVLIFISVFYLFYIVLMYSNIENLGGEYPLGYPLSLLLSFIITLYFFIESVSIYFRNKRRL